jgi:hypothetical protein
MEEAVTHPQPGDLPVTMPPPGALAIPAVKTYQGGLAYLAGLSDEAFETKLEALKKGQERVKLIQKSVMTAGEDYGEIAGRITLYKSGAEKLLQFYQLAATTIYDITWGDGKSQPEITIISTTAIHIGDKEGPIVAEGIGAATSWEKKYRWRKGERACPSCGVEGAVIKGNPKYAPRDNDGVVEAGFEQGGWLCWKKKDGCGRSFPDKSPEIISQSVAQEANPDPFDLLNTMVKMGKKRSVVDGTLQATATSGLFGQDLEDLDDETRARMEALREAKGGQSKSKGKSENKGKGRRAAAKKDPPKASPPEPNGNGNGNGGPDEEYKTWPADKLIQEINEQAKIIHAGWAKAHKDQGGDPGEVPSVADGMEEVLAKYSEWKDQSFRKATTEIPQKWLSWTYRNLRAAAAKYTISQQVDEAMGDREPGEEG